MNKQWKLLIGTLLSLVMYSCSVVDEEQNDVVNIKDASELYGTWEFQQLGFPLTDDGDHFFVFQKDSAYFIQNTFNDKEIGRSNYRINQIAWRIDDSNTISLLPDLRELVYISYDHRKLKMPPSSIMGIDSTWIYTFSNLDSIIDEHNRRYLDEIISNKALTIIEFNGTSMWLVTDSCYEANKGSLDIRDHCDKMLYYKNSELDVKALLSHVDTASSTEVCENYFL